MSPDFSTIMTSTLTDNFGLGSYFILIIILFTAAIIDIKQHRIPDSLVIVGVIIGFGFTLFIPNRGLLNGFIGGMAAALALLMISLITRGGLGLGDVKLFGCTGVFLGLENIVSAMLISAVLSGLFSLLLICIDRNNKKREIPFAPFILAGTLAAIIL